jgi:hypothetical protein
MSKVDVETNGEEDEGSIDQSEGSAPKYSEEVAKAAKESIKESSASPEKISKKKKSKDKETAQASIDLLTSTATNKFLDSNKKKRKKTSDDSKINEGGKDSNEDMEVEAPNESATFAPLEGEGSQGLASISSKRRKLWTELLVRRPRTKDPRHLSAWLNEVLTVSEFEIPLDQIELPPTSVAEDSAGGSGESDEEKKEKKSGEQTTKKQKPNSDEESSSQPEGEEKKVSENGKKSESAESSSKKSSPKKEDGFAGSFADWRDRKKEKAMIKKGTGSLRK